MAKLKLNSIEAKAMMQNLQACKVGEELLLPSLFPGLPGHTTALCLDHTPGFWQFALTCLGVGFASVVAEVHGDQLVLEEV